MAMRFIGEATGPEPALGPGALQKARKRVRAAILHVLAPTQPVWEALIKFRTRPGFPLVWGARSLTARVLTVPAKSGFTKISRFCAVATLQRRKIGRR